MESPRLYQAPVQRLRHSGFGIASFITAISIGLFTFVVVMVAGVLEVSTPGGLDKEGAITIIIGLLIIGCVFVALVGLILGIVGAVQSGRKKVFAVLGILFNATVLLGVIALMVIGTAMET